ncbi:hypothetical protein J6590_014666 [Homalodisca vitripennis]|nr:hypothetical protein J6590_014666 [Homalodisca vitripennis]
MDMQRQHVLHSMDMQRQQCYTRWTCRDSLTENINMKTRKKSTQGGSEAPTYKAAFE